MNKEETKLKAQQEQLDIPVVSDSYNNLDLVFEYEKVRRKIKKWENRNDPEWVMFKFRCKLIKKGIVTSYNTRHLKPVLWDAKSMMDKSEERFGNMNNETFFNLYKQYKSKL